VNPGRGRGKLKTSNYSNRRIGKSASILPYREDDVSAALKNRCQRGNMGLLF
jgi:hypothetical protein